MEELSWYTNQTCRVEIALMALLLRYTCISILVFGIEIFLVFGYISILVFGNEITPNDH